ncbi:MerR family transcriptional regulator [Paenibacillus sp. MMS20-IR301]|uniref:MerR family transcriptional regulator n=1 Tax=Paenibacillus sp. MMS20-IR301 TaxID=2895946 RepID=UPI0028ED0F4D|nr:MerR family transcriptional regulator [Paenibacillus sp. MMS20-IR301]WNS42965.1 MerR family transcriptional regulator [Paenibacillus sp. MMS20-IR301]
MKISEVAKLANLPISTIRYYEKMGIITEEYVLREENNYRKYAGEIIHHLDVVKNCLAVGFSIHDIRSMISKNGITKDEQTRIIKGKLADIEAAQKNLEDSRQFLYGLLDTGITCEDGFGKYK